jgi:hypothetical protein
VPIEESVMQIDVPLDRPGEAERLRTAVYRFSEMKAASPPEVDVRVDDGRLSEAATEFSGYWRRFRSERQAWSGFLDI